MEIEQTFLSHDGGDSHGVNPANSLDSSLDRCGPELAIQPRLGLLAQWRYRIDRGDSFDSPAAGSHLE